MRMRPVRGRDTNGLRVSETIVAHCDIDLLRELDPTVIEEFMDCMLEQRSRMLYKQSTEEDRFAKVLEIRDFSFVPVSEMLSMLMPLFTKLRPLVGNLQHNYPEMVFKVYIVHAPKAIGAFLDIWKPVTSG